MPPENASPPTPSGVAREMAATLRDAAENVSSPVDSSVHQLVRTAVEAAGLLDGLALMLDPQRPVTREVQPVVDVSRTKRSGGIT